MDRQKPMRPTDHHFWSGMREEKLLNLDWPGSPLPAWRWHWLRGELQPIGWGIDQFLPGMGLFINSGGEDVHSSVGSPNSTGSMAEEKSVTRAPGVAASIGCGRRERIPSLPESSPAHASADLIRFLQAIPASRMRCGRFRLKTAAVSLRGYAARMASIQLSTAHPHCAEEGQLP